jgi:ribosomal protein S18 acetylase RimI-like enzyme
LIRIRAGRAGDAAAINAVELSAGTLFAGTHMAWAVGDVTDPYELAEAAGEAMLWVAEAEGKLCGFLLAEGIGDDFHIWEIAVDRDHQRRGVGRLLVETALAEAARRGFARATLTTDRSLAWNAPWYRGLGFAAIEGEALPPHLAEQLAGSPAPEQRCAMVRSLAATEG